MRRFGDMGPLTNLNDLAWTTQLLNQVKVKVYRIFCASLPLLRRATLDVAPISELI